MPHLIGDYELQIGDIVRVRENEKHVSNYFECEAVFQGVSGAGTDYIDLKRLDGKTGSGRNNCWVFRNSDLNCLELVSKNKKNTMKTYTGKEYKSVIKMGDEIITNINGRNVFEDKKVVGKVTNIYDEYFKIKLTSGESWACYFENEQEGDYVTLNDVSDGLPKKLEGKKKKMFISIEKSKNQVFFSIRVPEEIENYYKEASKGTVKKSGCWFKEDGTPAEFYVITDELLNYEKNLDSFSFSDFGTGLVRDGRFNTALLRTVGATDKVVIKSENFNVISNMELEDYSRRLGLFVKRLWETTLSTQKIKSVITYEI